MQLELSDPLVDRPERAPLWGMLSLAKFLLLWPPPGAHLRGEADDRTAPRRVRLGHPSRQWCGHRASGGIRFSTAHPMMFEHLGWQDAADEIVCAREATIADKMVADDVARHMDDATEVKTSDFTSAIVDRLSRRDRRVFDGWGFEAPQPPDLGRSVTQNGCCASLV